SATGAAAPCFDINTLLSNLGDKRARIVPVYRYVVNGKGFITGGLPLSRRSGLRSAVGVGDRHFGKSQLLIIGEAEEVN
ncbi:MAG TPA: hypothetical protein VMJ94_03420, partial [Nitrososphaera sp.]|nr:hypothetical protein [Nitrososphaera sp.]